MIPKSWRLKPPALPINLKAILVLLIFVSGTAGATAIQHVFDDQDILDTLGLPLKDRLVRLKEIKGSRERLVSFAFDAGMSVDVRWRSLVALANLSAKTYRWEIEGALKSKDWFMRNAGLVSIMHDERDRAVDWSRKMINDPALVVRTQAVKNLIQLEADSAREEIWSSVYSKINYRKSNSLWIRIYMAKALALWARPQDEKRFLRLLMDRDRAIQQWAVYGLEHSTGIRVSDPGEPISVQRQKWLSRLTQEQI